MRIAEIGIKCVPDHYVVSQRKTINFMKDYSKVSESVLSEISEILGTLEIFPIDGSITFFHNNDLESLDVEIGWRISGPIHTDDKTLCRYVPEHDEVTTLDQGPYEQQDSTLFDMLQWISDNKITTTGPITYVYLNNPKGNETNNITKMSIAIQQDSLIREIYLPYLFD